MQRRSDKSSPTWVRVGLVRVCLAHVRVVQKGIGEAHVFLWAEPIGSVNWDTAFFGSLDDICAGGLVGYRVRVLNSYCFSRCRMGLNGKQTLVHIVNVTQEA